MSLSYLAVGTRPDIAYAVNTLARYSSAPGLSHWKALHHLVNFVMASRDRQMNIFPADTQEPLTAFVDASWGGQYSKSTYGLFITFWGCPVLWSSRRFTTIAASTCQAEFMALGIATRQALWVRHLLADMLGEEFKIHLKCDNQSAIHVSTNDTSNKRCRHVEREYFAVNEAIFNGQACVDWIPSISQMADILTKSLPPDAFNRLSKAVLRT